MVNDSVQILDDVAEDERYRVPIRYYSVTHSREETITSCEGDLIVVCNVLADYADMLDEFLQTDRERLGFCGALQYERMRDRCRKITVGLQEKTGYDRDAAIEKCRKKAGRSTAEGRAACHRTIKQNNDKDRERRIHAFFFSVHGMQPQQAAESEEKYGTGCELWGRGVC